MWTLSYSWLNQTYNIEDTVEDDLGVDREPALAFSQTAAMMENQ